MGRVGRILSSAGVVAILVSTVSADALRADEAPSPEAAPQHATAADMKLFEPYIGRFRSKTFTDDQNGKSFHYVVEYRWFDAPHTVVAFKVSTVVDGSGTEKVNTEGFYGYDPFEERIYVTAAMAAGGSGFGSVGEFDLVSHRRIVWAKSKTPDGRTVHVRDAFEVVDADHWNDVTKIRVGDEMEWREVYRDTFTRIPD